MNSLLSRSSRQLQAGLRSPIAHITGAPIATRPVLQRRNYADPSADPKVPDNRQVPEKGLPWPMILGGTLLFLMFGNYFLSSNKQPASQHTHSGSSGAANPDDRPKDPRRDPRDSPVKGTR